MAMWARSGEGAPKKFEVEAGATLGEALKAAAATIDKKEDSGDWLCGQYLKDVIRLTGKAATVKGTDTLKELGIRPGATFYCSDTKVQGTLTYALAVPPSLGVAIVDPSGGLASLSPAASTSGKSKEELAKELKGKFTPENILTELPKLAGAAAELGWEYLDSQAKKVFESKAFPGIKEELLLSLLKRETLGAPEDQIFDAVVKWGKANGGDDTEKLKKVLAKAIPLIRFPVMSAKEIASKVTPSQLLDMSVTIQLFAYVGAVSGGMEATPGDAIKGFNTQKRKPPVGELVFDESLDTPLKVSDDGLEVTHTGTNGSIYCKYPITEGKWKWTVDVLSAKGNCMTVGVAARKDCKGSGRVTGLHASGNCLDMQSGCGKSLKSFRTTKVTTGCKVTVYLDMETRRMGFEVNGSKTGDVVQELPDKVYPGIDMRERDLRVRLMGIEADV